MTTAQDSGTAVSANLEADMSLQPFERNWLLASGIPADSIKNVPLATLRELYGDILQIGPNYELVQRWRDHLAFQMTSGVALYDLMNSQDDSAFSAFNVQMSNVLNRLDVATQGDLWCLMASAAQMAKSIIKSAPLLFPASRRKEYNTEGMIRDMNSYCFHSILILASNGMLPEGSEAERLRQEIYPTILETMSQAGAS